MQRLKMLEWKNCLAILSFNISNKKLYSKYIYIKYYNTLFLCERELSSRRRYKKRLAFMIYEEQAQKGRLDFQA